MSAWPEKRGEIKKMMEMAAKDIERLGGTVELVDIGKQKVRMVIGFSLPSLFNHNFWNLIVFLIKQYLPYLTVVIIVCKQLPSGEEIPLPPIILGRLGSDPGKKTVCIYGHLDVQPANIDDGWDTEPFTLVEKDGESRTASVSVWYKVTLS